jgi:hypothetical protein
MNDVCMDNMGVSYERCLYEQLEESTMNGVDMDNMRSHL